MTPDDYRDKAEQALQRAESRQSFSVEARNSAAFTALVWIELYKAVRRG